MREKKKTLQQRVPPFRIGFKQDSVKHLDLLTISRTLEEHVAKCLCILDNLKSLDSILTCRLLKADIDRVKRASTFQKKGSK